MPAARTNPLRTILGRLGSLLGGSPPPMRNTRQVVLPWREDAAHTYPTIGITPSRVLAWLQAADAGQPQVQFELFHEMLQKWPRLAAVEATRRLALTGLDWEITPDEHANDLAAAERSADFCRRTLSQVASLSEALDHLARAIGHGIATAELVWEAGALVDIVPVPFARLMTDANEPHRLRIRTETHPSDGVALDEQPWKWIVHRPNPLPGRHFESGLLRGSALLYVAQNLSFKDWLIYSQIAGMPIRVARFEPGTPDADKQQLLKMLETLGTDAVAVFSKSIELELHEGRSSGDKPYEPLQDYCNREVTIMWLGQHLTTEIRENGSRAAAEIHDRVREDLLVNDIADESRTLRRCVLAPLVQARFGADAPVPHFRRSLIESVDTKVLAETLAIAVQKLRLAAPRRWVHRALGIPEPMGDEPVLAAGVVA